MKKIRRFLRHRFTRGESTAQSNYRQYELFKEAWRVNHPEATPAEYEAAMREIARKLGI